MDTEVDHYAVLGLPSCEESSRISEQEIVKAYRSKARVLHPDKRLNDPNAHGQQYSKRRKMMSDLEEGERSYFSVADMKAREEEERIARKLKEEIARIVAAYTKKTSSSTTHCKQDTRARGKDNTGDGGLALDKEKVLKVSWEKIGGDYTDQTYEDSTLEKLRKAQAARDAKN
ncbi:hypothetical protein OROGR_020074 [Orobanche gracilis]